MRPIYIAYHRWHRVAPWLNWIPPSDGGNWWREFDLDEYVAVSSMGKTLGGNDLSYKHVDDIGSADQWLYEINWFYQDDPRDAMLDQFISNQILMDGLLGGNGYLVLNLALEAWCQPDLINRIQGRFRSKGIPCDRVAYMTGARNAKEIFSRNGYQMLPIPVMEFEVHSSLRAQSGQVWTEERNSIEKRFLCFNRLHRPHRVALLAELHGRELLPEFHYSFPRSINGIDLLDYARQYMGHQSSDHDQLISRLSRIPLPMILDTDDWGPNLAHAHGPGVDRFYQQTGISVITETTGYDEEIFFSEKTFHPIRNCQPFMMVSAPGTLMHLRQLGYGTFSEWWDEGYDLIQDHQARMEAVVDQIQIVAGWSDQRFREFLHDSRQICLNNLKVLIAASHNQISWSDLFP